MTRLLYVHNITMPGPEANTVNVAKMCNAFAANDCDVVLAALPGAPLPELASSLRHHYALSEAFPVAPLPSGARRPALAALSGIELARRIRADLVYTRAPHVALAACLAGIPAALEVHTGPAGFSALGRLALKRAAAHAKLRRLIVISEALATHLRETLPKAGARITVAHDGADPIAAPQPRALSGDLKVGFVGRFYPGKGLELIAQLAPLCPWAHFHIIGGEAASARAIAGAPFPQNVIFHGAIPHADAADLIAACDVVLAPYQRTVLVADGRTDAARWMSPLKLFEYMAAGKAILASDLPVLREVLRDGETAMLLAPDQPGAWADALQTLRDSTARREALGARAKTVFLSEYTWRQRARRILDALGIAPKEKEMVGATGIEPVTPTMST